MYQYLIKTVISAIVLVAASEISKRFPLIGALLISLPLVSILALIWLWLDTGDKEAVAALSINVFWLVIPSLVLFISLPVLLKKIAFGWSLAISAGFTIGAYYLTLLIMKALGKS